MHTDIPNTSEQVLEASVQKDFQSEFDARYITSSEVIEYVGVTRPALFVARQKGYLPGVISIADGKVIFWEREFIMPHLKAWRASFRRRNGEQPE